MSVRSSPGEPLSRTLSSDSSAKLVGESAARGTFLRNPATGVWSLHFPRKESQAKKAAKPTGYLCHVTRGDPMTHLRPILSLVADPFDLRSAHLCPKPRVSVLDPNPIYGELPMVRVFDNKFPAVQGSKDLAIDENTSTIPGVGWHEVVVQHWRYNMCQALMTQEECNKLWAVLVSRVREIGCLGNVRYVQLMENHGPQSGGSLPHPHSQVLGLPMVPSDIEARLQRALLYWRKHGRSVYSEIKEAAMNLILTENEHAVAFVPNGGFERSIEFWVMPKRASPDFTKVTDEELASIAQVLRQTLGMLYIEHSDPDYNMALRSVPCRACDIPGDPNEPVEHWFSWHIEVIVLIPTPWQGIKNYGGFIMANQPGDIATSLKKHASLQELPEAEGRDAIIKIANGLPMLPTPHRQTHLGLYCVGLFVLVAGYRIAKAYS